LGLDVGDKESQYCLLDASGKVRLRGRVRTTREAIQEQFGGTPRMRIALETGTHSPWISRLLEELGHEVVVANARELRKIHQSTRKNDRNDAETLARLARVDPQLLCPVQHRSAEMQADLGVARVRDGLVRARSRLIATVRTVMKTAGHRMASCSADSFAHQAGDQIPREMKPLLAVLIAQIGSITEAIHSYDKQVEVLARDRYPETSLLKQVKGVGDLTALVFLLTLGNKQRFAKSRDVGPYLGLVPRQQESGERSPQLPITKAGNRFLRRLLVTSAHYILGPHGPDTDLRRFGLQIAGSASNAKKGKKQGNKGAKKRAVVAVARKLAVLLHRLWTTGEVYEPLREVQMKVTAAD
jgi:transposase